MEVLHLMSIVGLLGKAQASPGRLILSHGHRFEPGPTAFHNFIVLVQFTP